MPRLETLAKPGRSNRIKLLKKVREVVNVLRAASFCFSGFLRRGTGSQWTRATAALQDQDDSRAPATVKIYDNDQGVFCDTQT